MNNLETLFSKSLIEKEFLKQLTNPEIRVVSFDIFDTLFFRKCGRAQSVFEIMGATKDIVKKFDTASTFSLYRQNAEKQARKLLQDSEDISLESIYLQLPLDSTERETFIQKELFIEEDQLLVNPQLERWIKLTLEAGKRVILTSDMYLSHKQMYDIALFQLDNIENVEQVYISNECGVSKATGNLFRHILEKLNLESSELLHIGDNERSDVMVPQSLGIQTIYYGHNREQKVRTQNEEMYLKEHVSTAEHIRYISSLLSPYIEPSTHFYFTIAANIFGPLLWEFSHWLESIKKLHNIKHFGFIMREGALLQEYYKKLYPTTGSNLIFASRKSTNFTTIKHDDIGSVNFAMYRNFTLLDLYNSFYLKINESDFNEYCTTTLQDAQTILIHNETLFNLVIEDIQAKKESIKTALEEQENFFKNYLRESYVSSDCALIDFGGSGSVIQRVCELLDIEEKPRTNILFYEHAQGYMKLLQHHTLSFLPLTQKTAHAIESINRVPEFLEILLNGSHPTTLSYKSENSIINPVTQLPITNKNTIITITDAFKNGIDSFYELAKHYELQPQSYDRELLTLLIGRLIELPTPQESHFFGSLEYDEGKATQHTYKLIEQTERELILQQGSQTLYDSFLENPTATKHQVSWMEGALVQENPNFLIQKYGGKKNVNEDTILTLLKKLDNSSKTDIMVYGAGELFIQLLPYLQERNITVEQVIDTRAEVKNFEVEGFKVVSLAQAFNDRNEGDILVASGVYTKTITQKIKEYANYSTKDIRII